MPGLSRTTLKRLDDGAHLAQSIGDILSTPIGSRVMRRDYGSDLPRLLDAPINGETMIDVFAATADAIDKWEPRFALTRVELADASAGTARLILSGDVASVSQTIEVAV